MQAIDSVLNDLRADLDKLSTRQTDLSAVRAASRSRSR
jgi:hypothetical protein